MNRNVRDPSSPFEIHLINGYNPNVSIKNVTNTREHPTVAYACGHIVTINDCSDKTMEYLLGHEEDIVSIKSDKGCHLVVTADKNMVNIWDRQTDMIKKPATVLLKTLNKPMNDGPISSMGLSFHGEYLVLVNQHTIQLWIWKNGDDKPDATFNLPDKFRVGSNIRFCGSEAEPSSFVLTTETNLLFCRWIEQKKVLETHTPANFPGIRQIVDSCYCTNYCQGVSITNQGSVILWSDTPPSHVFKPDLFKNQMEFQLKLKLGFYPLRTVSCLQGYIAISDSRGELKFYDEKLKFCFFYDLTGQTINSISFIKLSLTQEHEETKSKNRFVNNWTDKDPSCIGDFFVSCENGKIFLCSFKAKPTLISECSTINMTCIDVHPNQNILCGARENGEIFIYNYEKNTYDNSLSLPIALAKQIDKTNLASISGTHLKFSSCGRYIACGLNNGHVLIMNTLTFDPCQRPIQLAEDGTSIEEVIFSQNNKLIVYYDAYCTVGLLSFESSWKLIQKCRVHDSPIVHISFRYADEEIGLITISEDHCVAKYTIQNLDIDDGVDLEINDYNRVDFLTSLKCCIPMKMKMVAFPHVASDNDEAFLTTDGNFKFHMRHFESFELVHTFAAPVIKKEPITTMKTIFLNKNKCIAFLAGNVIGLHRLPIDGNPNKYLGVVGHSRRILAMKVSPCNKYVLTIGEDDPSLYIWRVRTVELVKQYKSGGTDLKSFCRLIQGGVNGQLFTDMQDLFFYLQIKLQKEQSGDCQEFKLKDGISVANAIDFLRGVGFFPSKARTKSIMNEIWCYADDSSMITFENMVKLYVNYKPPFGYLKSEVIQTLQFLGTSYSMNSADTEIDRDRLIEICTSLGETMDPRETGVYFNRLDNVYDNSDLECDNTSLNILDYIRSVYTLPDFMRYVLGIE